jgi:hypothetical protein
MPGAGGLGSRAAIADRQETVEIVARSPVDAACTRCGPVARLDTKGRNVGRVWRDGALSGGLSGYQMGADGRRVSFRLACVSQKQ